MSDKREFGEDYMFQVQTEPYQAVKHYHRTLLGMTGWSRTLSDGQHWHPSPDGPTTPASDEGGHRHQLPSKYWTGERLTV